MRVIIDLLKADDPNREVDVHPVHIYDAGKDGAIYIYRVNGKYHNVHVPLNPNAKPGEQDPNIKYDHSMATMANGMNMNEVGRRMGTYGKRINESYKPPKDAPAGWKPRDPAEVHLDEKALNHSRDMYAALQAHNQQFGDAVAGGVHPKAQQEHVGPIADSMSQLMHKVRTNNEHLDAKSKARVNQHFLNSLGSGLAAAAKNITGNDKIRFDFQKRAMMHGPMHNSYISPEDFGKLHQAGFFADAAKRINEMHGHVNGPISDEFLNKVNQHYEGLRSNDHPQEAVNADWYHRDIDQAKANFMNPINSRMGVVHDLARQNFMASGADPKTAHARATQYAHETANKLGEAFHGVIPGTGIMANTAQPGSFHLNTPNQYNNHNALAQLQNVRNNAAQQLDKHIRVLHGAVKQQGNQPQ